MKTAIITDSGANLTEEIIKKYKNLYVLPLIILVDGAAYKDQVEIKATEVYAQLDEKEISTSLPNITELYDALADIKKQNYDNVIIINISSGLSGTFNAFHAALSEYTDLEVFHYDSKTLAAGQGYLVEQALELVEKETAPQEIISALDKQRSEDSIAMYTINTLKYLKKGGRIGKVEGTIGNILHIKPVITVNPEGVYVTLAKTFGLNRALIKMREMLIKKFEQVKIDLTIHYGDNFEEASSLGKMLRNFLNIRLLTVSQLTPVLGIHTGPMMFAYVARKVE
ncbi:MAG: DegV family protein [Bacilli bacterium]|nr:DegV family protein [Bacilli bacterium]